MAVVLIHWYIKPNEQSVAEFLEWWTTEATVNDTNGLAGEFLSAPVPARELPFRTEDLGASNDRATFWEFVNIGIWKSWESFLEQVGHNIRDDNDLLPFEADIRTRTVLEPQEWRLGDWPLPGGTTH